MGFVSTGQSPSLEITGEKINNDKKKSCQIRLTKWKDSNQCICSPCLGSHWAPQLAFKFSKEAFDICLRCVFKETLCGIFLPSQPGVGFVEVWVQTRLRSTTIQQLRRWWLGLPWTTAECERNESTYLSPSQQQQQQHVQTLLVILTSWSCGISG